LYPSYRGPLNFIEWQITNSATGYNYTSTDSDIEFQVPSLAPGTATTIVVTDPATVGGTVLEAFTLPPCPI